MLSSKLKTRVRVETFSLVGVVCNSSLNRSLVVQVTHVWLLRMVQSPVVEYNWMSLEVGIKSSLEGKLGVNYARGITWICTVRKGCK